MGGLGYSLNLKPSCEPIVLCRKPISERTIAENVMKWGTGGINIDGCRIEFSKNDDPRVNKDYSHNAKAGLEIGSHKNNKTGERISLHDKCGRFPANTILDDSSSEMLDNQTGVLVSDVSRFFYCAKTSKKERGEGNIHPTVKPIKLIRYLVRLITPPNGISLDPFLGSGTHSIACLEENFNYIGFELDEEYFKIAKDRLNSYDI